MKKQYTVALGIAFTLASGVGVMWLSKKAPEAAKIPAPSTMVAPADAAHEIASLEEELKKKPGHSPILVRLADLHQAAGHAADAAKYLKQVIEAEPSNYQARLELGRALYDSGDIDGALAETKKILEKDPQNVDALYNVGAIYGNQGNLVEAKSYFAKAVAADSSSDSGQKSKAAIAQLDSPATGAPPAVDPRAPLPPGHPTIGATASAAAVVDRLLVEAPPDKKK